MVGVCSCCWDTFRSKTVVGHRCRKLLSEIFQIHVWFFGLDKYDWERWKYKRQKQLARLGTNKKRPLSATKDFQKCWSIEVLMSCENTGPPKIVRMSSYGPRRALGNCSNPVICHPDLRQTTFSYKAVVCYFSNSFWIFLVSIDFLFGGVSHIFI